jgi:hypothetical protein
MEAPSLISDPICPRKVLAEVVLAPDGWTGRTLHDRRSGSIRNRDSEMNLKLIDYMISFDGAVSVSGFALVDPG